MTDSILNNTAAHNREMRIVRSFYEGNSSVSPRQPTQNLLTNSTTFRREDEITTKNISRLNYLKNITNTTHDDHKPSSDANCTQNSFKNNHQCGNHQHMNNNSSYIALDDLNEKEIISIYHRYFPKGTKVLHARCGCGYLHPFITIPCQASDEESHPTRIVHNIQNVGSINSSNHNKIIIRRNFSNKDMKLQIISGVVDPHQDGPISHDTNRHEEDDSITSNIKKQQQVDSSCTHDFNSMMLSGVGSENSYIESDHKSATQSSNSVVTANHVYDTVFSSNSSLTNINTSTILLHETTRKNEEYLRQIIENENIISNLQKQLEELKQQQTIFLFEKEKRIEQVDILLNEKEQKIHQLSQELENILQEKDFISNNLANGIESNKRVLESLESELTRIKNEMSNQEAEFSKEKQQLESELCLNNEKSSTTIQDLKDQLHHISSMNTILKREHLQSQEQNNNYQAVIESLQSKFQDVNHSLACERQMVQQLRSELEKAQNENTTHVNTLKKVSQELTEMNSELDILKKALSEKQSLVDDLETQLIQARLDMERSEREATFLVTISTLKKELTSMSDQLLESRNHENSLICRVGELENELQCMYNKQKRETENGGNEMALKFANDLKEKEQVISQLNESLSELKRENRSMLENFENLTSDLKSEITQKEVFINSLQREIEFCREQTQSQTELLKMRIEDLNHILETEKSEGHHLRESSKPYRASNDDLLHQIEILRINYTAIIEKLSFKEKQLSDISEAFKSLENDIENSTKEKKELKAETQRLSEMNYSYEQKLRELNNQVCDLTDEILKRETLLQVHHVEKQHVSEDLQKQLFEHREKVVTLTAELKERSDSLNEKHQIIDNLQKQLDEFKDLCSNQTRGIEQSNATISEHKNIIQNLRTQLQAHIRRCEDLSNDIQLKDEIITEKISIIQEHERTIEELRYEISTSRKYHTNLQDQINILQEKLSSTTTEYNTHMMNVKKESERIVAECKSEAAIIEQQNIELVEKIGNIEKQFAEKEKLLHEKVQLCEQEKLTNNELSKLKKENLELRQYVDEVKQSNDKMQHEVERLLEQITSTKFQPTSNSSTESNSNVNVSILSNNVSISDHYNSGNHSSTTTMNNSSMLNNSSNKFYRGITSTKSPSNNVYSSLTTQTGSPFEVWKQLRSEILRLKQKNVEMAQQIMQVTKSKEEAISKLEKELRRAQTDCSQLKKVEIEFEKSKTYCQQLEETLKKCEENNNVMRSKLELLEKEKLTLWRLHEQTRNEVISLKETTTKLTDDNLKLARAEQRLMMSMNKEVDKLKKEKKVLEERLQTAEKKKR